MKISVKSWGNETDQKFIHLYYTSFFKIQIVWIEICLKSSTNGTKHALIDLFWTLPFKIRILSMEIFPKSLRNGTYEKLILLFWTSFFTSLVISTVNLYRMVDKWNLREVHSFIFDPLFQNSNDFNGYLSQIT